MSETVTEMTDAYDDEGYESMSLDTYRNKYFIDAILDVRLKGATSFLEIGPGADAKLTRYVLDIDSRIDEEVKIKRNEIFRNPTQVLAIEINQQSFERASEQLHKYKNRIDLRLGDAIQVLEQQKKGKQMFDCMIAEVIGFIASCEGQCRLIRAVAPYLNENVNYFIPQIFGTYFCAYKGDNISTDPFYRCRHKAFTRFHKHGLVVQDKRLILEEWNSVDLLKEAKTSNAKESSIKFQSSIHVEEVSSLIGFIELKQSENIMCSSASWSPRKKRAENWDLFILPFSKKVTGTLRMESTPQVFGLHPIYKFDIFLDDKPLSHFEISLNDLLTCRRYG